MGHIGVKGLHAAIDGLQFNDSSLSSCAVCACANICHLPFPNVFSCCASTLLKHIHCDICGPLPNAYGNFSYYILFINCYSRFISLFLMKTCNEALSLFIQFKTAAENFCNKTIKILHVNNAPELVLGQMLMYCKHHSISYKKTVPNSPPQNGVAKWSNLTLCSMARTMLLDTDLCDFFWPFAILMATHIKQCIPHSSLLSGITPFQLWFGHRLNLSHLCPFGTNCTACVISNTLSKFQPCGESGCFLGYARDAKGYLIWVLNNHSPGGSLKVRCNVIFHNFPSPTPSPVIPNSYLPLLEDIHFENRLQPMTYNNPHVVSHKHIIEHNPEHHISDSEPCPEHISDHCHGALNTHPPIPEQVCIVT